MQALLSRLSSPHFPHNDGRTELDVFPGQVTKLYDRRAFLCPCFLGPFGARQCSHHPWLFSCGICSHWPDCTLSCHANRHLETTIGVTSPTADWLTFRQATSVVDDSFRQPRGTQSVAVPAQVSLQLKHLVKKSKTNSRQPTKR